MTSSSSARRCAVSSSAAEIGALNNAWLSVHNYAHNHPVETEGLDDANLNGLRPHQVLQAGPRG